MTKSINFIITLCVIIFFAFQMRDIYFGNAPANNPRTTSSSYVNATGEAVSLSDYHGNYMWVDYAAEWCTYCDPQTRTLKGLKETYGDKLTFLTVVAGTNTVMEAPTADTAMKWARRYDLDTDKVLAHFSTETLPYHILYSPSGTILFQGSGLFDASKITNLLNTHTSLFN